jgi:hypothetical protein
MIVWSRMSVVVGQVLAVCPWLQYMTVEEEKVVAFHFHQQLILLFRDAFELIPSSLIMGQCPLCSILTSVGRSHESTWQDWKD